MFPAETKYSVRGSNSGPRACEARVITNYTNRAMSYNLCFRRVVVAFCSGALTVSIVSSFLHSFTPSLLHSFALSLFRSFAPSLLCKKENRTLRICILLVLCLGPLIFALFCMANVLHLSAQRNLVRMNIILELWFRIAS